MEDIGEYCMSGHALLQMERRGIPVDTVHRVVTNPDQVTRVRPGRLVLQARMSMGPVERLYLVRVFVDDDRQPAVVVTVYRTTKFARYGSPAP